MSQAFLSAVARVLAAEGGYVNDAHDPGGETKFGISKRSYPTVDIAKLTLDQATAIYERDFWAPIHGDELPYPVALIVFDGAVNQGVRTAIRHLQQALGVTDDGIIGPATIMAAKSAKDPVGLAGRVIRRRILAYATLDGWTRYGPGWVQRCLDAYRAVCTGGPAA